LRFFTPLVNVLYEDNGAFKVAAVLADGDSSLQVETPHGKRAKIKARDVLLRFPEPAPAELLAQAEAMAGDIETDFLWQCCGTEEFDFAHLARGTAAIHRRRRGGRILVKLHWPRCISIARGGGDTGRRRRIR
jgi:hypothetical protein